VIGIAFVAIGVGLLHFSNELLEFQADYTQCQQKGGDTPCWKVVNDSIPNNENKKTICECEVEIEVTDKMVRFYK